jgi:hypothetical protein
MSTDPSNPLPRIQLGDADVRLVLVDPDTLELYDRSAGHAFWPEGRWFAEIDLTASLRPTFRKPRLTAGQRLVARFALPRGYGEAAVVLDGRTLHFYELNASPYHPRGARVASVALPQETPK